MTNDTITFTHVEMAVVHRPNSAGVDLPAGANADSMDVHDYRIVEMPDVGVEYAAVHRPNDVGIDLPAGASADDLAPTDYRPVEMPD
jgi:hypothetical protein